MISLVILSIAGVVIAAFCTSLIWKIIGIIASAIGIIGNAISFWHANTWYVE